MTISLNWLREYISVPFSPEELAHRLTMLGLEIEDIENTAARWNNIVVGEVLDVAPHPNADKLHLTKVTIGNGEPLRIVCGAPNVRGGLRVAVAKIGADLGEGFVIKKAKIRGEISEGMLCSERELGVSQNHEGIWELSNDLAIGVPLAEALNLSDVKFEIGITPNRADCLSHIGIAREIRAITGNKLELPKVMISKKGGEITKHVRVSLPQSELCPRYVAKLVRGVTIKPSPDWLKKRLEAVGLRPINNVVDITNFVLIECGHPLHAFDFDSVDEGHIVVRTAAGFAEEYTTLDSKRRKLPPEALLISDGKKPLGIAGIMGGENSEIRETTKNVLIESAYFAPSSIRRTAKAMALSTDASYRFERGTDFNILPWAAERAAQLIQQLAGGEIVEGMIDEYPQPIPQKTFSFRPARANALIGMEISLERMREVFDRLEIDNGNLKTAAWSLTSPSYRIDLEREEDAIEEIARVVGYEEIPTSTFERTPLPSSRDPLKLRDFESILRSTLLSLGASECVSSPLVSRKNAEQFHPNSVEIINPLNIERDRVRTSIAINLLEAARVNERFHVMGQRIFEIGNIFHYSEHLEMLGNIHETTEIGNLISGIQEPKATYNAEATRSDIFLMKGIVERLFSRLGIRSFDYVVNDVPFFNSQESLAISKTNKILCRIGKLTSEILKEYDLRSEVWLALIDYEAVYSEAKKYFEKPPVAKPLPKYPSVERDLALMLSDAIPAKIVQDTIRSAAPVEVLREVTLFDQFQSKEMKLAHERSLAFHLLFRLDDRTLEEQEVDRHIESILKRLEGELHARLRA